MIIVVMGICSSGKTLIGQMLAKRLGLDFYDADDFHPQSNIKKMKSQMPLNDDDRLPWLRTMAEQMPKWQESGGAVLACSALKQSYRNILMTGGDIRFVFLNQIYFSGSSNFIIISLTISSVVPVISTVTAPRGSSNVFN